LLFNFKAKSWRRTNDAVRGRGIVGIESATTLADCRNDRSSDNSRVCTFRCGTIYEVVEIAYSSYGGAQIGGTLLVCAREICGRCKYNAGINVLEYPGHDR
jgi:hypothetical protein